MAQIPPHKPESTVEDRQVLLTQLRRKEGTWVSWALSCKALQEAGMSPQQIFEETGFEPIQQNQIIVASQVYRSIAESGIDAQTQEYFERRGSDQLYEMRILSQEDRAKMASFVLQHGLDADDVKDLVKPVREYAYRRQPPEGFVDHPGDAIAFHYWNLARQKADLQDRSRLIAQGLRFVHSSSARQQIEKLLTDFAGIKNRSAPSLPLYRLESEAELPRIVPVAGQLPLPADDFNMVPVLAAEEPFGLIKFSGTGAWIAVPGWQVIWQAEDPIGVLSSFQRLSETSQNIQDEPVLVICDRSQREWRSDSYYLVNENAQIDIDWFADKPQVSLVGRVILILRPKKILDEGYTHELWQLDE